MVTVEPAIFPLDIRFSDMDAMNHVNNAKFFTYFEEGRKHLFFKYLKSEARPTFDFILAKSTCEYKIPLLLEDRAVIELWSGEIGTKSFVIKYSIHEEGNPERVFATGESVLVSYDYKAGRSTPIDDEMRAILTAFQR